MSETKRYHPLVMLYNLWSVIKSSFLFALYLFIIKYGSESTFIKYGRMVFILIVSIAFVSLILRWFTNKYKLDETAFYLYKGLFTKTEQTIPFSKIKNINRRTTLFHRVFNVTSIRFETGMSGEDDAVIFDVISETETNLIEEHVTNTKSETSMAAQSIDDSESPSSEEVATGNQNRAIHFKPTRKDVLKASFTSLSFLVLIPLIGSFYYKFNEVFDVEEKAEGFLATILNSWWIITIIIIVLIIASATFGIVRAFLKYGKYEISSDQDRIYITQGFVDKAAFSISKKDVQAIEITQSTMKRLFGLAEVKLISVGSLKINDGDEIEVNSLYPFLPVKRAYEMISEILPSYQVTQIMTPLPKKSLWIRMFEPSWFWVFVTVGLLYFKPSILEIKQAWWMLSVGLFFWILILRLLDYINTRYTLNDQFIQFKTGSLTTSLFISKRDKVIEMEVTRNPFQKSLGLASVKTINQAKPLLHTQVDDVPVELADLFYTWYTERSKEIKVE